MNGLIGTRVEQYQIEARIGQGHLGTVYRARDLNLGRLVAIKVMHRPAADQPSFQQHVMQAAQTASRLNHPSIVNIYNFDNSHGLLYIVMEFVPGRSLAATLKQAAQQNQVVRLNETLHLMAQIADALSHAHQQRIVHGNLRPDNVLLKVVDRPTRAGEPPIRAILTDFGLSRSQEGSQWPASNLRDVVPYFSPEQCRGDAMDSRADIYSLGVLLYQMTTGNLPFAATSPAEVVARHGREPLSALHYLRPSVPMTVNRIIKIAMANKVDERFQDAEQMAHALRRGVAMLTEADALLFAPQGAVVSLVSLLQQATQQPESSPAPYALSWEKLLPEQPGPPPPASPPAQQPTPQLWQAAPPPSQNHTRPFRQPDTILPPLIHEDSRIRVDQLIITRRGGAPRTVSLDRSAFRIGRSRNNDIILSTPDVSRRHARLAQTTTGWQITDLHSSGGTYLGARKLAPSVPETWDSGQLVRIGPYLLRWQRPGEAHVEGASSSRAASAAPGTERLMALTTPSRQRLLLGQSKIHPVEVVYRSSRRQEQVKRGQVDVQPAVPVWLLPTVKILLVLLFVGTVIFAFSNRSEHTGVNLRSQAAILFGGETSPTVIPTPIATQTAVGAATAVPTVTPTTASPGQGGTVQLPLVKDGSGWITESGQVGIGLGNAVQTGDGSSNESVRGFLSFDVSVIPNDAIVESARLILPASGPGLEIQGQPFDDLGCLLLEAVEFSLPLNAAAYYAIGYPVSCENTPPASADVLIDVEDVLLVGQGFLQMRFSFETPTDSDDAADLYVLRHLPTVEVVYTLP